MTVTLATVFSDAPEWVGDIEHIDLPFIQGIQKLLTQHAAQSSTSSIETLTVVIYQLWIQKIFQYMLADSMTMEEVQNQFLEELRVMGLMD